MIEKKAYFRVIDHSQGSHIGDAELNYWADCESAEDAIKFFCDSKNKHSGTKWELYKLDGILNKSTNTIEAI